MSEITLDFGTTAQKQTQGEAIPVVLLALDQGRYDMTRSLDELRALAEANGLQVGDSILLCEPEYTLKRSGEQR